jgi:hypothetical protein
MAVDGLNDNHHDLAVVVTEDTVFLNVSSSGRSIADTISFKSFSCFHVSAGARIAVISSICRANSLASSVLLRIPSPIQD